MIETKILYASGGVELLDEVQPLWEQLNEYHSAVSPHFKTDFLSKTFAGRKKSLMKKYPGGQIRIDIAQLQERSIGYLISAITSDGTGEIESIYIEESYRGQDIGTHLMRRALNWLEASEVHRKLINVAVGNERTYEFYERFGFFPQVVTLKQR